MTMNVKIGRTKQIGRKNSLAMSRMALFLTIFAFGISSLAQSVPVARLLLRVVDSNRAAIVGARVTLARLPAATGVTGARGEFSASLPSGEYVLAVEADGFAVVKRSVKVTNSITEPIEIVLPIAEATAVVTITGTDTFGYRADATISATRTLTNLRDVPQAIAVVSKQQIEDQSLKSIADVVNYVPGVTSHQGENNR